MPNAVQNNDAAYQPPVKGCSYSSSDSVSATSQNTSPKKSNIFLVLALEIFGLLFLFFVFLAVLNYFNFISLKSISSNLFGFLPHRPFETSTTNNQIPAPIPEAIKSGLATREQIEEYQTYVKQKGFADALSYSNDSKNWSVEGLYAGYKNNIVNLVTTKGLIKFPISEATGFETIIIVKGSKEEGGGSFKTAGTYKLDEFLQTVTTGKFLQIYYTKLSNKDIIATRVIYYPDLR